MPPALPPLALEVVKVGGSLLSWELLPCRLAAWLEGRAGKRVLLIAGGGALVRQLRQSAEQLGIAEEQAHWLAIRLMAVQARILSALVGAPVLDSIYSCHEYWNTAEPYEPAEAAAAAGPFARSGLANRMAVFDALPLLEQDAGQRVPVGWHVTSDSIAAYVARCVGACRLVLLKSIGDGAVLLPQAVANGWVDPFFPQAIGTLPVEWVNLRAPGPLNASEAVVESPRSTEHQGRIEP